MSIVRVEGGNVSLDLLLLVLSSSISSIVNLFTRSSWSTSFTSYSMQNSLPKEVLLFL